MKKHEDESVISNNSLMNFLINDEVEAIVEPSELLPVHLNV